MDAQDRQEILDLIANYSYGYDTRDWDRFASVWDDAAQLGGPGGQGALVGPDAIVEWARTRREGLAGDGIQTRHYQTNTLLEEINDGRVRARTMMFIAHQHQGEPGPRPMHTGEYNDEFVRTSEGWRFARRELQVDHD